MKESSQKDPRLQSSEPHTHHANNSTQDSSTHPSSLPQCKSPAVSSSSGLSATSFLPYRQAVLHTRLCSSHGAPPRSSDTHTLSSFWLDPYLASCSFCDTTPSSFCTRWVSRVRCGWFTSLLGRPLRGMRGCPMFSMASWACTFLVCIHSPMHLLIVRSD